MLEPISRLLRRFAAAGNRDQITAELVLAAGRDCLKNVAGGALQTAVTPQYFRADTLGLGCASAAAAQEARLHESELLTALNARLGRALVRRFVYHPAPPALPRQEKSDKITDS